MIQYLAGHWQAMLAGGLLTSVLSYAARTLPSVENPWGRWLIGVIQFALANPDKFKSPDPQISGAQK